MARQLPSARSITASRWWIPAVTACALAVWAIENIGWRVGPGRDFRSYVFSYAQLFDLHPVLPWAALLRGPLAALGTGAPLELGVAGVHVAMALFYAVAIVAWTLAARVFGPRVELATPVALMAFPSYGIVFHGLSGDAVFATVFAVWALVVTRALTRPSLAWFAALGLATAALALTRPVAQVLVVFCLAPLLLRRPWAQRGAWAAAAIVAAAIPISAWIVGNGVRNDDYTLGRGGGAVVPFHRAFVTDRIVQPDNGPASRALADAVRRELLTQEPYRSYGITLEEFFTLGSSRMHEDLVGLSDRVEGWDSDYALLARVGREAVRAHPSEYTRGVLDSIWHNLTAVEYGFRRGGPADVAPITRPAAESLPRPSEGQPIPSAYQSASISTPGWRIREVWTSPTEHHVEVEDPADAARFAALGRRVESLMTASDAGTEVVVVRRALDLASRLYPRPILFLAVGVIALLVRRPRCRAALLLPAVAALLLVSVSALGVAGVVFYALPVAPAFVLLALGALLAPQFEQGSA
jgi:hypothetical protein